MRRRAGFTLLELLLALAITLVVASALSASLYTAFHAKRSIDDAVEATRTTDVAGDTLAQELANCLPPTPSTGGTTIQLNSSMNSTTGSLLGPFSGLTDAVDFY